MSLSRCAGAVYTAGGYTIIIGGEFSGRPSEQILMNQTTREGARTVSLNTARRVVVAYLRSFRTRARPQVQQRKYYIITLLVRVCVCLSYVCIYNTCTIYYASLYAL